MNSNGYIKLHRSLVNRPDIYNHPVRLAILIHLLFRTNWKESRVTWSGKLIELPRGQGIFSQEQLAKDLKVHRATIARHIVYMQKNATITVATKAHSGSIVTFCNYDKYQGEEKDELRLERRLERNSCDDKRAFDVTYPKNLRTKETKNNDQNLIKDLIPIGLEPKNEILSRLEWIYKNHFPRKIGKSKGIKKLIGDIKNSEDLDAFELAVKKYAALCLSENRMAKHIQHFSSFATDWRDWLEDDHGTSIGASGSESSQNRFAEKPRKVFSL